MHALAPGGAAAVGARHAYAASAHMGMMTGGDESVRMFLTMMVEHHGGAVEMATTEKANGRYASARKTADDIITAQNAEIEEMNKLLGKS
ncbi:DUF305 domain-containing protein [Streptomyces sp. NPDC004227]